MTHGDVAGKLTATRTDLLVRPTSQDGLRPRTGCVPGRRAPRDSLCPWTAYVDGRPSPGAAHVSRLPAFRVPGRPVSQDDQLPLDGGLRPRTAHVPGRPASPDDQRPRAAGNLDGLRPRPASVLCPTSQDGLRPRTV